LAADIRLHQKIARPKLKIGGNFHQNIGLLSYLEIATLFHCYLSYQFFARSQIIKLIQQGVEQNVKSY
jgi:hypothetical protein